MVQHGYWAVRMDTSRECLMQIHSSPAVLQYLGGTWQNAMGDTKTTSKKIWHKNLVGKMSYIRKDNGGIWMCQKREKNKMLCRLFPAEDPRRLLRSAAPKALPAETRLPRAFTISTKAEPFIKPLLELLVYRACQCAGKLEKVLPRLIQGYLFSELHLVWLFKNKPWRQDVNFMALRHSETANSLSVAVLSVPSIIIKYSGTVTLVSHKISLF